MTRPLLWLRSVLFRNRLEQEMQAEMEEHIERSTKRLIARGLSPEAARLQATREFGNVPDLQEEGRIARGTHGFDTLLGDVRFAFRHFVRNPLSTLTMVTVLSIGIAVNVVLFTMVYSFTERPPSGIEPSNDLVRIRGSQLGVDSRIERAFTIAEFEAYRTLSNQFAAVAGWTSQLVTARSPGVEEATVTATFVTDQYFNVLGTQPIIGRGLVGGNGAQLVVLSHAAWTRTFGEDPGIVGRTITLAEVPFTVAGVAPPRFRGAAWEARNDMQVWLPLPSRNLLFPDAPGDAAVLLAIARLKAGTTRDAASAASYVIAQRLTAERTRDSMDSGGATARLVRDPSVEVVPLLADNLEPGFENEVAFAKLAVAVLGLLTLLVTCANLGSLQTGLALARRREIAIRMSLGAQRLRIVRQLVTESLLLSVLAGVGAVALTLLIIRVILWIVGSFSVDLVFNRVALFFTFGIALAAGLLFGLSPALHATRVAIAGVLKDSAGAVAGGRARLQRSLVVAQIAFTQPLAVCVAALVIMGITDYRENPPNPYGESIVQLRLTSVDAQTVASNPGSEDLAALGRERLETERLIAAFAQIPGITQAAFVPNQIPVSSAVFKLENVKGTTAVNSDFYLRARAAMPGYLGLVGTPIILGRDLLSADTAGFRANTIPAVIGDDMARSLWGDGNPIGQRVGRAEATEPMTLEIVGVYDEDADALGHSRRPFTVFVPPDPRGARLGASRFIMLRLSASAETVVPTIRRVIREEAPRSAIVELRTLASFEKQERSVIWGALALFSTSGLVVLLLCALGLYAVVAFAVGQRTGEIAVRMAIGARGRQVVRHFASDGLRLTLVGVVLGLPLSALGLYVMMSLAPEAPHVSVAIVMATVAIGVLGVASLASWIPASRAAKVDPSTILRRE